MLRLPRLIATGLILLGAFFASSRAQSTNTAALPLPENYFPELKGILEAAAKQSPRMILRNLDNVIAEQSRIAARSGQLPTVGGFLQYNPWQRDRRADLPEPTDTKKLYYNLSLNQPLFHWGALQNNTRIGELQAKITQGQTAEAYRGLAQEIRGTYLQLVLKKLLLARTQLHVEITRDQLAVAQTKFEKKVISEGDLFMPRLNHDQAILSYDRALEDFDSTKRTFAKLTGTPAIDDNQIAGGIPTITPAPDLLGAILATHVSKQDWNSYYLETLRKQLEVEKLNYKVAANRLRPNLNMIVGVSQDEQSYTANIANKYKLQSTFVGFQVSWSIFDGFAAHSAVASSDARRRQLQQTYEDAQTSLSDLARAQFKQIEFSARSMELANRLLGSAEGNLAGKKDELARGLASEAEVSNARLGFLDAQINAFNSRFDYLMKTGDFLSMILEDPALTNLANRTP